MDAGNYVLSSDPVTTTASITAVTLTASGITAGDKVYDGSTTATLDTTGATLAGVVGSDDVSLDTSEAVGPTLTTKNVGTGKTVTVFDHSFAGMRTRVTTSFRPFDPVTGTTASITAVTLTASGITAGDKVYDGSTTADTRHHRRPLWTGVVGSDDVSLDTSEAVGTFDDQTLGTGKTVTVTTGCRFQRGRG